VALVVEDGSGLADAESYVSVDDADAIYAAFGGPAQWGAAATSDKERWLRLGCRYLDQKYGRRWVGSRANQSQALDWPMADVEDDDGYCLDSDVVPEQIKRANVYAAFVYAEGNDPLATSETSGELTKKFTKVGPLIISKEYESGQSSVRRYPLIENEVSEFITTGSPVERA